MSSLTGDFNGLIKRLKVLPYVRWVQPLLRSKFVHKKYKLHYETRTHITRFTVSSFIIFAKLKQ